MKEEVLKKLKELGWEYVVDEFTHSECGHRREHFERVIKDDTLFVKPAYFVDAVLIFHYVSEGKHDEPTIQTYSTMSLDLEKAKREVLRKDCCSLNIEEMQLFLEYMQILAEEDRKEDQDA